MQYRLKMPHIWYNTDRHEQGKNVIASFLEGPRTDATAEILTRPITGLQRGQIKCSQAFP